MPWKSSTELRDVAGALIISIISGTVSITRRIANGQPASIVWVISEFLTAILCGYLMYDAYPHIKPNLPEWTTLPLMVAFAAHAGGRMFQEVENELVRRYTCVLDRRRRR